MRRRPIHVAMLIATLSFGLLTLLATVAFGQVGYPPGPQAPVVSQTLPPVPPPTPVRVSTGVAFTGADVLRWGLIAVALVAAGTLLILANRRRARVAG